MADRPILFSAPMVRALLDGRKTQTRRLIEPTKKDMAPGQILLFEGPRFGGTAYRFQLRFEVGDRLWVKETYRLSPHWDDFKAGEADQSTPVYYQADIHDELQIDVGKQRPSIFMPRWASRLTLTVTDVRVQRLQDCSEEDAVAEGLFWDDPTAEDREWAKTYAEENGGDGEVRGVWTIPGTDCGFGPKPRVPLWGPTAVSAYASLWNSINGAGAWEANPWICAVSFTVERRNVDA